MCTCSVLLLSQMLTEEGKHLAPAIHGGFGPVQWPVPVPDAVAGAVVAVELVRLAVLLQFRLVLVHLLGARRAVVVAEDADERAGEVPGQVDRRDRRLVVELLFAHHHAATPQFRAGVDVLLLARIDERVPAARAGAEQADLTVVPG